MTDKKDKIQPPDQKKVDDSRLWEEETKDVKPLKKGRKAPIKDNPLKPKTVLKEQVTPALPLPKPKTVQKPELDRRNADRLRKGQIKIEARLDLHGMSREKAYHALCGFIPRCYAKGFRCVLVITGKGAKGPLEPETGVLKKLTPEWLNSMPLSPYILRIEISKQKDGGAGAFYVLLRRQRD